MSMESNMQFCSEVQNKLNAILTFDACEDVMRVINDVLCNYTVERRSTEDSGTDFLIDVYLNALTVEGRSEQTIARYKYVLDKLFRITATNSRNITVYHIRTYFAGEKNRGISDATLNGERMVFNSYFTWLYKDNLIEKNPMANIGSIKCQKKVKVAYSEIDFEKLKVCCSCVRDKAILCFLASTGCRIHEVTQLNRNDVDLINMECKVLGKGNKERRVYIDAVTAMVLSEYLKERKDDDPALFVGRGGKRLESGGIRIMLKKLGKAAGVDHVHPHKFRRTLATNLIKHGMPIQNVASILGHEKLDTTMKYVVMDQTQIKSEYQRYV